MSVAWSDPHQILSYDRMHNDSHGLGGKHILPSVLLYLKATGRDALADLDKRFLLSSLCTLANDFVSKFPGSRLCLPGVA
jgi:hypothetical protein